MIYGYARCSTNEKEQDINRQVRELKQQGATDKTIYLEYESGMKTNRAELAKLLDIVKPGDTILATEVSRITRSTKQLCDIIELAKDRKIKLVLGSLVVDCTKNTDSQANGFLQIKAEFWAKFPRRKSSANCKNPRERIFEILRDFINLLTYSIAKKIILRQFKVKTAAAGHTCRTRPERSVAVQNVKLIKAHNGFFSSFAALAASSKSTAASFAPLARPSTPE